MAGKFKTRRAWSGVVTLGAALLALACLSAPALAQPALGGQWHMDELDMSNSSDFESTPDISGNGSNLSALVGTGVSVIPGRFQNAISFDGSSALRTSGTSALEPAQLTVLAWVKAPAPFHGPGPDKYLVEEGADGGCNGASYALYTGAQGGIAFYVWSGSGSVVSSPEALPSVVWDGNWHAVAGTYDGSAVHLFVDGTEVGSGTPASVAIDYHLASQVFVVGAYPCANFGFTGAIDELRVYDGTLTPDEINQLQTTTGDTPPVLQPPPTPPVTTPTGPTGPTGPPPPPVPTGPIARFSLVGASQMLPGAAWLNASGSSAGLLSHIVNYAWDITNSGQYTDPCGGSPIISAPFKSAGPHTVGLRVTDSAGQTAYSRLSVIATASMVNKAIQGAYDCENPGGAQQASTADCIKTFGWGIFDINSRGGPGDCFQLTARAKQSTPVASLFAAGDEPAAVSLRSYYWYHATITGPVAINGLYFPIPSSVKTQYDDGDATIGLGTVPLRAGPFGTFPLKLNLTVTPQTIPADPANCYANPTKGFHLLPSGLNLTPKIGGLPVGGGAAIDWLDHSTRIIGKVNLPNVFGFAPGQPAQGTLCMSLDNAGGFSLDGATIAVPNAWLGPIALTNLSFTYLKDQDVWSGGATVTLPGSLYALDASPPPPDLGFGLRNGDFDHGGVGVDFGPGAQPQLFPGVFLRNIHIAIGVNPLRITGGVGITAGQIVDANGDIFVAFASPGQPYFFPQTGGDLAPLSGRTFNSFSIAVGGNASLHVPFVNDLALGNAYLLYEFPYYFEFGGNFSYPTPILSISGNVGGFVDPAVGQFDVHGQIQACLTDEIEIDVWFVHYKVHLCIGAGGDLSSKGVGICAPVPVGPVTFDATLGWVWGSGPRVNVGFGCDFSDFQVNPTRTRDAHAAETGLPLQAHVPATIRLTGASGAPDAMISEPDGTTFSTASPPSGYDVGVFHLPGLDETLVALRNPSGGRWTATAAPGSTPITSVAYSHVLPDPHVHARVRTRGTGRVLTYELTPAAGREVTFVERGRGVYHVLGGAHGRRGAIRFRPATGPGGPRQIIALVTQDGIPTPGVAVAAYIAPRPARLQAPTAVRVSRTGTSLRVSWKRVSGAWRYSVMLSLAGGRRELLLSRSAHVTFLGVDGYRGGSVRVSAIGGDGQRGPMARQTFTAVARRPTR